MGYDRRFCLRSAANPTLTWANIDTTLWSLAFAGQASASHCHHCFCLSHTTVQHQYAKPRIMTLALSALSPIAAASISADITSVMPIKDISAHTLVVPLQLLILKLNLYSDNNYLKQGISEEECHQKSYQCFAIYMAICCRKHPQCIHDLLGYQTLIVEVSLEYQGML